MYVQCHCTPFLWFPTSTYQPQKTLMYSSSFPLKIRLQLDYLQAPFRTNCNHYHHRDLNFRKSKKLHNNLGKRTDLHHHHTHHPFLRWLDFTADANNNHCLISMLMMEVVPWKIRILFILLVCPLEGIRILLPPSSSSSSTPPLSFPTCISPYTKPQLNFHSIKKPLASICYTTTIIILVELVKLPNLHSFTFQILHVT